LQLNVHFHVLVPDGTDVDFGDDKGGDKGADGGVAGSVVVVVGRGTTCVRRRLVGAKTP
jgi:hypothetical protein